MAKTDMTITVGGEVISVNPNRWTFQERAEVKASLLGFYKGLGVAPKDYEPDELDLSAAAIWLERRRTNHALKLAEVMGSLTLDDITDGGTEDDSPEA